MKLSIFDRDRGNRLHLDRQKVYDLDSGKIRVNSEGLLPMGGEKSKK